MTLLVSAPLFIAALVTGLIVSIFQAATQINESTLSFVPKLIAIFVTLILAGPWMITHDDRLHPPALRVHPRA